MTAAASRTQPRSDLRAAFEQCTLSPADFSHRNHLALGWSYLRELGFPDGAARFREQLQAYVAAVGATAKFHETITWAYLVLLNEEMTLRSPPDETFESMIQRRPDLLDHRNGALAQCYPQQQLDSDDARRVLMLPRRQPLPLRSRP